MSFCFLALLSISISIRLAAQEDRDKNKDEKGEAFTGNVVKVEGSIRCQKADPGCSIEIPDRPGHALTITQRRCEWTKPLVVADAKTKEGVAVGFAERMESEAMAGLPCSGPVPKQVSRGDMNVS